MNKVGAIFDKPKSCVDCPCSYFTEGTWYDFCQLAVYLNDSALDYRPLGRCGRYEIKYGEDEPIPDWCPLREVVNRADLNPIEELAKFSKGSEQ